METATQISMRTNLRQRRAEVIAHEIMKCAAPYIHDAQVDFFYALRELLEAKGADIVTDYDREQAGLPPRGPDGWTADELIALERKRLDLLCAPIPFIRPTPSSAG